MVNTKKFSEFVNVTPTTISDANEKLVGLESGVNMQSTRFLSWTTAGRPPTPFNGLLGVNTTLKKYEWWDSFTSAWLQLAESGDITALIARLAAHTASNGASMIGLLDQSGVTSKTVQDLADATFIAKTDNGTLHNAQFLGSLTTGIVKNTTVTGVLSISAPLTQIDNLSPVQGNILYYNGAAWVLLAPGTPGYVLQTQGAGANPQWVFDVGTGTVTSLAAATGITLTPDPITTAGTIGLTIPVVVTSGGTGLTSTTVNQLLYSSSNNVIAGLATTNSALLATNSTGVPTWLGSLTDGQIIIGSTGATPVAASLSAGSGVTITPGAGTITISATGTGGTVTSITAGVGLTGGTITTSGTIDLTVPVIAANGGTGLVSPTAHGIMIGEGTSAMTPIVLSSGQILIGSTGVDPVAAAINSGTGILVANGAGSITVSLASIATLTGLVNTTGGSAAPSATTLTAWIDAALGSTQGNILYRNATVWTVLAPGTSGDVLTTGGAAANPSWTTNGSGTVTSVATGAGLTGGTITSTGTIALAAIADHTLLANISGGSLAPSSTTLTALIDNAIGSTQGNILYRNATVWTVLAPGTSGQFLQTLGAGANPAWAPGDGAGTVTSVATNNGLTGGTITSSGTIGLASIADLRLLANISGGSTFPSANTLTAIIDACIGSTQGNILYRNATVWTVLAPGTSGQLLQTGGAAANPSWTTSSSVSAATQAQQEAASSTTVYVSPGRQQYHPSAAKAWGQITISAGAATAVSSYNVSSVSNNATGNYSPVYAVNFSSGNYCVTATVNTGNTTAYYFWIIKTAGAANSCQFLSATGTSAIPVQADLDFSFNAFGDQA